jgi:protein transport protein SEC24
MRVRSSAGISVDGYDGACHMRTPTDIDLAAVDCDKTFLVKLGHDAKLEPGQETAFQCALLYTTTAGERRIRLHTLAVKASASISTMFRTADLDTQLLISAREGARGLTNGGSTFSTREAVLASCVNSLSVYREFCASSSSTGQLILPEALKLLPLYILALNKSPALNTGASLDHRSGWCSRVGSTNSAAFIASIYPRLFAIHELGGRPAQMRGKLPKPLPLSYEKLVVDGVYLMEDGVEAYIWPAKNARPEVLQRLLGVPAEELARKEGPTPRLGRTDSEENQELHALLDEIRRERSTFLRLRILRHGDRLETLFFNRLVEDRSQVGISYVEFLCQVHRDIQNKMS